MQVNTLIGKSNKFDYVFLTHFKMTAASSNSFRKLNDESPRN